MGRCLLPISAGVMLLLGAPAVAWSSCVGTPLAGLDPTGLTDNTTLIQAAIDQKAAAGGGAVILDPGRYLMTGSLLVKRAVVLCGAAHGPFDPGGTNPATTTIAPTLLVTNTQAPFITLGDFDASVTDLLFHYPNQVLPTATAPVPYPFTIVARIGNHRIERCTATNAYQFLDVRTGRVTVRDLNIGAFFIGIHIDHALDHVTISNIIHSVFWDIGFTYPEPIDTWVMDNGSAFVIKRVDGVTIDHVLVFHRHTAFVLTDSPDPVQIKRTGYGSISNVDIDTCNYGIRARSTDFPGYKFSNIDIGCGWSIPAIWGVAQDPNGSSAPRVLIEGGSIRGQWAGGLFQRFTGAGKLIVSHVFGYDE
jgi:hypothetical protein